MNSVLSVAPYLRAWRRTLLGCTPTARCHCFCPPNWTILDLGHDRPSTLKECTGPPHDVSWGTVGGVPRMGTLHLLHSGLDFPIEEFSLCNSWRIMSSLRRLCSWDLWPTTLWSRRPSRLCSRRPSRLCPTVTLEPGLCPSFWVTPELCPAPSS